VLDQLRTSGAAERRVDPGRATTLLIALATHLVTVVIAVVGAWIVVTWPSLIAVLFGLVLLALAWHLRPRLGRRPPRPPARRTRDLPLFHGLLEDIAASIGGRVPDYLVIERTLNAGWSARGLRRQRVLIIGWWAWTVASPQARVALLGHELAHEVNGDTTRSLFVGTGLATLDRWGDVLRPAPTRASQVYGRGAATGRVADWVMLPFAWMAEALTSIATRTSRPSRWRAEHRADVLGAQAAGSDAAVAMLGCLELRNAVDLATRRTEAPGLRQLAAGIRAHLDTMPDTELERLRRVGARREHAVDANHPPTGARIELLRSIPQFPPAVVLDADTAALIDEELLGAGRV
jgi:hypothetical protein